MAKRAVLLLLVGTFVWSGSAYGHHNFSPNYVLDRTVTIEGTLTHFVYQNPHSYLYVDTRDAQGHLRRWAVEWAAGAILARDGVVTSTLKPGDQVIVTGNPGRDPQDQKIRMTILSRPSDGWKWIYQPRPS